MDVIDEADPASKAAVRKARIRRMARTRRMLLAHLWLIERGRTNVPNEARELTPDERIVHRIEYYERQITLIKLAIAAGGIDALRQGLDNIERRIKPKHRRPLGSPYETIDKLMIWNAYETFRLANPPISKRTAIARVVKAYYASNKRGEIGGGTERSVIERLMRQGWPSPVARGMLALKMPSE